MGGIVDNALSILSIHQSHPPGARGPVLLDPAPPVPTPVGHLLGLGIQTANGRRNVPTRRDVFHHEAHEGPVDGIDALGGQRRELGPIASRAVRAARALEEDSSAVGRATDLEDVTAHDDVDGIDPADIARGVESHFEEFVDGIVRRGEEAGRRGGGGGGGR